MLCAGLSFVTTNKINVFFPLCINFQLACKSRCFCSPAPKYMNNYLFMATVPRRLWPTVFFPLPKKIKCLTFSEFICFVNFLLFSHETVFTYAKTHWLCVCFWDWVGCRVFFLNVAKPVFPQLVKYGLFWMEIEYRREPHHHESLTVQLFGFHLGPGLVPLFLGELATADGIEMIISWWNEFVVNEHSVVWMDYCFQLFVLAKFSCF